ASVTQEQVLTEHSRGLQMLGIGEIGGGIGLQNDLVRLGRGEKASLHAFEAVARGSRSGQAGDLREMARRAETQIAGEAKFGIDLEDGRALGEFAARVFIERTRDDIGVGGIAAGGTLAAITPYTGVRSAGRML